MQDSMVGASIDRRTVLKVSGGLLGGIAAGTTVVAAAESDRFIVDTAGGVDLDGLDVVHEMTPVDLAVVRGSESDVESLGVDYAADTRYSLQEPLSGSTPVVHEEEKGKGKGGESATDEPYYDRFQWDKQALDVPTAHGTTRGEGTRVAIIDSGIASGHPDLQHAVDRDRSKNFADDDLGVGEPYAGYHGTHVAGIVAADDGNEAGVVGTAPGADLVDCRVFTPFEGGASFGSILAAMTYSAVIDADVANLSLGAYPIPRQGLGGFYGKALNRTMTYANKEGTVLSISAGNDAADLQHDGNFISLPNEGAQAVSVSATGPIGFGWGDEGTEAPPESPANYTNYGTNAITIGAPGGDYDPDAIGTGAAWYYDLVFNAIAQPEYTPSGKYLGAEYSYGWVAGTSMAAPQVTGAVALLRSQDPTMTAGDVESALKEAASVPDGYDKTYYGAGFLNIVDAL